MLFSYPKCNSVPKSRPDRMAMIPETRLVLPPPVASDEAVSEVPIEDVLSVIDCDNLTKNARIHNLANLSTWREIP